HRLLRGQWPGRHHVHSLAKHRYRNIGHKSQALAVVMAARGLQSKIAAGLTTMLANQELRRSGITLADLRNSGALQQIDRVPGQRYGQIGSRHGKSLCCSDTAIEQSSWQHPNDKGAAGHPPKG